MQEMERRKYDNEEQKSALVPDLRVYSRQAYLEKREAKKLDELEQALRDEETLFAVCTWLAKDDQQVLCIQACKYFHISAAECCTDCGAEVLSSLPHDHSHIVFTLCTCCMGQLPCVCHTMDHTQQRASCQNSAPAQPLCAHTLASAHPTHLQS